MNEKILVSACLVGRDCKYNGGNNKNKNVLAYLNDRDYILVCPETLGGLKTPRLPAEIEVGKDGTDVIEGKARVYSNDGKDVTKEYIRGAELILRKAVDNNIKMAILKESSPSCGSNLIYDGKFAGKKKSGIGVTVALLKKYGVKTISEKELDNIG